MGQKVQPNPVFQVGHPSPWLVERVHRYLLPVVRALWRPTLTGLENLPQQGPFLLVANHSGGFGLAEILSFVALYLQQPHPLPLAGFAHPLGFHLWPLTRLHRELGSIRSTYADARSTLALGIPILVFPGGDHEAFRPIWQANRVDFGGRVGFLRIAREAGVPIVPMGIQGSHFTAPMLWRSRILPFLFVIPRLCGIKRWPLSLLGALVALALIFALPQLGLWRFLLAFLWLSSVFALLPWIPWTVRIRVGKPIQPEELAESLPEALKQVEAAVQTQVAP